MRSRYFESNTIEERIEIFREYFDRDVESAYSSSVACCESCFADFEKTWPGTVSRDLTLQRGGIDIETFLEGSWLQDDFYPEEIDSLKQYLECPNCGAVLNSNFWIYEHPFSIPEHFNIRQIADLAQRSPFLLLSHPFAQKVFETISELGKIVVDQALSQQLYRARLLAPGYNSQISDFAPPPITKVAEGRYNHAEHAMLYLAESERTAIVEIRAEQAYIHVAVLEFHAEVKILDLSLSNDAEGQAQEVIQCLARSSLCAAPRVSEGWARPEYVFSRFVADCALHAGFSAIRYGSVRDPKGVNLVLLEPERLFVHARLHQINKIALGESSEEK